MINNRIRETFQDFFIDIIFIIGCLIMSFTFCLGNVNNGSPGMNVPHVVQKLPSDKKCTHCYEEMVYLSNKEKYSIETSDIFAFAAIIVSLFSLYFSKRQTNLQKGQFDSQKRENQPIFQVESRMANINTDKVVDTDIMVISNVGNAPLSIDSIEIKTYVKIIYRNDLYGKIIYIPIHGYYFHSTEYKRLTGEILINKTIGNNVDYTNLYYECIDNSKYPIYYLCDLIKFVAIQYTDIYDEKHVVYFESDKKCSEDYYKDVVQKSKEVFKEISYDIKKLKFEDVQAFLKFDN